MKPATMTISGSMKSFAVLATMLLSLSASAASVEEGLRLKAANKLDAAATEFSAVLAKNPQDGKAIEQLAIVQGWLGRYDASISSWMNLLTLEPQREDARIAIARVQYWQGDRRSALSALDDVLKRQPNSADALALRGDVLAADNDYAGARAAYSRALQAPGADVADINRKLTRTVAPKRWRIDIGGAGDHFSNERGTEESGYAQLGYTISSAAGIYTHFDYLRQFKRNDQSYIVGGYWRVAQPLLIYAEGGYTPDADFRPDYQGLVGAEVLAWTHVQPLISYRYFRYQGSSVNTTGTTGTVLTRGNVNTITPGVRLVWPGVGNLEGRYGLTYNLDDSETGVAQFRINFEAGELFAPYVAFATGKEALPPQAEAKFSVYSAGSVINLSPAWSLRGDFAFEHRAQFYDHGTAALGLSYKF